MSNHQNANHEHHHGPGCGHKAVMHDGHVDYLHDGHLHHDGPDGIEEHVIPVDAAHPDGCTGQISHGKEHTHGPNCGHQAVPHGDHIDYLVDGVLHHQHDKHCDHHGTLQEIKQPREFG